MRDKFAIATVVAALVAATGIYAQQPAATPPAPQVPAVPADVLNGISGIWNRIDPSGGGSYDDIYFPEADLTPEYAAKVPRSQYEGFGPPPPGWTPPVYSIAEQGAAPARCAVGGGGVGAGGGGLDVNSGGMALMASKDLVLMLRDGGQGARQIYTDGRAVPARPTGVYSVGHFENGTLIVKSRGFAAGVVGGDRNRGRAYRETTTEVTEVFKPSADGKRLVVTYTYEDPKVFVKPWVYDLTFERLPANQYAFESWCDSRVWIAANAPAAAPAAATRPAASRAGQ